MNSISDQANSVGWQIDTKLIFIVAMKCWCTSDGNCWNPYKSRVTSKAYAHIAAAHPAVPI